MILLTTKRREWGTKERRQTSQQQKHVKRFKVDQEEHEKGLKLNKCYPSGLVSEWVGEGMEVVDMDSLNFLKVTNALFNTQPK